jgi:hypothetical protein
MITEINKIKSNDLIAVIYYLKVNKTNSLLSEIIAEDVDSTNNKMKIAGKEVLENAFSADQFEREEKVNKTTAAEILINSCNRPFTVSFTKEDGNDRILRGRLIRPEPLLGRSMVEDLDAPIGKRIRQVDHRTLNYIIVNNCKYSVYKS